jgi:methionyl-tRNA formyltransferase
MRLIFMGTPAFAVPALNALHEAGHEIIAVYTRAPQPAGRGKAVHKSPVHQRAEALGLQVRTPMTLKNEAEQAEFASFYPDAAIVAAYGLLLPQAILDVPARGCLNIHASLLPRWRGAAPIQRAILAGDKCTGVTIMQMEAGLDTGPMLLSQDTEIADKNAGILTEELSLMGARLMLQALDHSPQPTPQPADGVTLAPKISKAEARLNFSLPAAQLLRSVRAFNPAPGAFTEINGERLKILDAEVVESDSSVGLVGDDLAIGTAKGVLQPLLVQRAGKPPMRPQDLLRGWRLPIGAIAG